MSQKIRILYVASEIDPFLRSSNAADFVRQLPQAMHDKGMEIRILVPRFGLINERRNRLHEVVRLSGINITVGDEERPLVIKVASVPNTRMQVYFIDNEDYFHRKSVFVDKDNAFHTDNDERAIFFCKGVMETVKKLNWPPHIVHCTDWMTSLIPLYMKTTYKNDPVFKHSKSIFSVYDNTFEHVFDQSLIDKVKMIGIEDAMIPSLQSLDCAGFVKTGTEYADVVVRGQDEYQNAFSKLFAEIDADKRVETFNADGEEINYEGYYKLYNELVG